MTQNEKLMEIMERVELSNLEEGKEDGTELYTKMWWAVKVDIAMDAIATNPNLDFATPYEELLDTLLNKPEAEKVEEGKYKRVKRPTLDELKAQELKESMDSAVTDTMTQRLKIKTATNTLLNNLLIGRRKQTLSMYKVPVAYFDRPEAEGPFVLKYKWIKLAESRLVRFFESSLTVEERIQTLQLNNGEKIDASAEYSYYELKGNPIMFIEFVGEPLFNDMEQILAYEKCKDIIINGHKVKYHGDLWDMEYAESSASEMRQLKGMYVRRDLKFSEEYLSNFAPINDSEEEAKEFATFMDTMRSLRGAEVIYVAMSYGAYLYEYKGLKNSPAKFMARMGMSQTSTKSLGNTFKVKHIGEVKVKWTKQIENGLRAYYSGLVNPDGSPMHSENSIASIIAKIKSLWKEEKLDGQSIITDKAVIKGFAELGIRLRPDSVIGKLIQLRWAGVKGTAICLPQEMVWTCQLPDGTKPYEGYDMIVEHSSWKYTPCVKRWREKLTPELELVAISKTKASNNMNYQAILALDGDGNKMIKTIIELMKLLDSRYAFAKDIMSTAEIAKAYFGLVSKDESDLDDLLGIDEYEKTMTTVLAKALEADDSVILDRSWRMKVINRLTKMRDKIGYGKIPVEGANRFIISDPICMLRTDLAIPRIGKDGKPEVDHDGNPMFDIIIDDVNQLALSKPYDAYWNDKESEAVMFRSPCIHPGEPQKVNLVSIETTIPDTIKTGYGVIEVAKLFGYIKDIVVVNCFSSILDSLGGADTDGDTVLVVTEPTIVKLRSLKRPPMITKIESDTLKEIITPDAIKRYMAASLRDNGIGRITNWATTFRDIELMIVHMPNPKGKYRLPANVVSALYALKREAAKTLKLRKDTMLPDEVEVCMALCALEGLNDDTKYRQWSTAVVVACESALRLIRRLQETAINTAKSGVFVDFPAYKYIKLKIRATWHRKTKEESENYDSWSTMGSIASYSEELYNGIKEWANKTSVPLTLATAPIDMTHYRDVYKLIREYKASYGAAIYANRPKPWEEEVSDTERMDRFREISNYYHNLLRKIAVDIGSVDDVSIMAYRAVNTDKDKNSDDGLSFVWQCWGEEFVHTLRHFNSGKASRRLVSLKLSKEYETYILAPGTYMVCDGRLIHPDFPDVKLGYAKVPDGDYELLNYDEIPYLLKDVIKTTVDSMKATYNGIKFKLIGFKYHEFNSEALTRAKVKELLVRGNFIATIVSDESGKIGSNGQPDIRAMVYVDVDGEHLCIGNVQNGGDKRDETGYFAQALCNKVFRLILPTNVENVDKGYQSRLTLEVADVINDLSEEGA